VINQVRQLRRNNFVGKHAQQVQHINKIEEELHPNKSELSFRRPFKERRKVVNRERKN